VAACLRDRSPLWRPPPKLRFLIGQERSRKGEERFLSLFISAFEQGSLSVALAGDFFAYDHAMENGHCRLMQLFISC